MNYAMIVYTVGNLLRVEAALLLLPAGVALLYGESPLPFALVAAGLAVLGTAVTLRRPAKTAIYAREGFFIVGISWILLSLFGALPFVLSGEIPHFVDAFFETVSGFTTTGASILNDVEALSRGMLFWRSFTHWVGGMGVLVFVLAVLPKSDARTMYIMKAEVPGPTSGKLLARVRHTALLLYAIYLAMTLVLTVLLMAGGMPAFDALVHAFGTAGTGGFGIKGTSIGYYDSAWFDAVIGIFMVLFGVNFNLYYLLLLGDWRGVLRSEELRWYLGIVGGAVALITVNILPQYGGVLHAVRYAFFQVASIITTTGYATADFCLWPQFSQTILVLLMFVGAMAGSTGGGMKVSRIAILLKDTHRSLRTMISPRSVRSLKFEDKTVDKPTLTGIYSYLTAFLVLFCASILLLSLDSQDHVSNLTGVAACLNNIGPGLGVCGPMGNYAMFSDFSKLVLCFDMLAGRLEIFPLLMLFSRDTYRRG